MVAPVERTRCLTTEELNAKIRAGTEARVAYYMHHPDELEQRLRELDREWDIDRAIELEASGTVVSSVALGMMLGKKWFLLAAFASAMLLVRNLRGEYPLLPVFRRLGFRTATEINQERYALKLLRGDFEAVAPNREHDVTQSAFAAARPSSRAFEPLRTPASEESI